MTTLPLDVDDLLGELEASRSESFTGLPPRTTMGHVHLKVADIKRTVEFYRDALGFALMAELGPYAAFLSAGGYHHHVGATTWESAGATPPPPGSAALRHATIVLPDEPARDRVLERLEHTGQARQHDSSEPMIRDPSGNWLALEIAQEPY